MKGNSAVLQEIFYIYFKILVENPESKFLRDCLSGTLAYAHLISVDLIANLISYLDQTARKLREDWQVRQKP